MASILSNNYTEITQETLTSIGFQYKKVDLFDLSKKDHYYRKVDIGRDWHDRLTFYYFPHDFDGAQSLLFLKHNKLPSQNALVCIFKYGSIDPAVIYPECIEDISAFLHAQDMKMTEYESYFYIYQKK